MQGTLDDATLALLRDGLQSLQRDMDDLTQSTRRLTQQLRHAGAPVPDEDDLPYQAKHRRASVRKTMSTSTPAQALAFLRGAAAARFCGPTHLNLWAAQQRLAGRLE